MTTACALVGRIGAQSGGIAATQLKPKEGNSIMLIEQNTVQNGQDASFAVDTSRGGMRSDVSEQWWSRPDDQKFTSLNELRAHTQRHYEASRSDVIDNHAIEIFAPEQINGMADTRKIQAGLPDGRTVDFSHWSFGQTAQLAKAPAGYLRTLPTQISSMALRYGLRFNREIEQVKTYHDGTQLRAVTGPQYGRIPDYEVVQAVQEIAGDGDGSMGWKVPGIMDWSTSRYNPHVDVTKENTTLFGSDRDVFIFLVDDMNPIEVGKLDNGDPDLMFRGFYVWNSEVGSKSYGLAAMYLRGVCMNRCLWGVENFSEFKGRHSSGAPDRFMHEARPALHSFTSGGSQTLIEGVKAAKEARVADDDEKAVEFLRSRKFSKSRITEIMETVEREEGHPMRSAWDAAQGITAVARKIGHQDDRLMLELEARKILDKVA